MEKSGKLPTVRTTPHISSLRQPEGAVNMHGSIKVVDKTTGIARWVDAKKGLIRAPDGDPSRDGR